jgi:thymidine kinase
MSGRIKVIAGEMFSGKSRELARLVERALIADWQVAVVYPAFAARSSPRDIVRRMHELPGRWTLHPILDGRSELIDPLLDASVDMIAVDEAQFFTDSLPAYARSWRHQGKTVILAGLDLDYEEHPFGSMGALLCLADEVMKVHAVCTACKNQDAFISHRLTDQAGQVVVGESNYTALCLDCYDKIRVNRATVLEQA